MPRRSALLASSLFALGCHDLFDGVFPYVCEAHDESQLDALPSLLSETGLYENIEQQTLAAGVTEFQPRFELWSDGATKRRWLHLPDGATINTSDADDWVFPQGTKVWKEFTRDGVRVETRLIAKLGPSERPWLAQAYVWGAGGDARAAPMGYVDVGGTPHDVPASLECAGCHGGRRSFLLGVSAVQLASSVEAGGLDLARLAAEGRLSQPLEEIPRIPGNATAQAGLGYLHANCGHCHSSGSPSGRECFDPDNRYDFWLRTDALSEVDETPTVRSGVPEAIERGDSGASLLIARMRTRDLFTRMPPFGTEVVDEAGVDKVARFIEGLR